MQPTCWRVDGHLAEEDRVLRQGDGVGLDAADDGAAHDRQPGEGRRQVRRADRAELGLLVASTMLSVTTISTGSVCAWFPATLIEPMMLWSTVMRGRAGDERQAGLGRPRRLAVAFERPAGHQRDVTDLHVAQIAFGEALRIARVRAVDLHRPAEDDQPVEAEAAPRLAGHGERRELARTPGRSSSMTGRVRSRPADLQAFARRREKWPGARRIPSCRRSRSPRHAAFLLGVPGGMFRRIGRLGAQCLLLLAPAGECAVDRGQRPGGGISWSPGNTWHAWGRVSVRWYSPQPMSALKPY